MLAISVRELVKEYRIYANPADRLRELVTRRPRHMRLRSLDRVSFGIRRGEVVGVIGRNGAGKSTLLKVLTGLLDYDEGDVQVAGSVAAILELGAGINPEYSGRDNILFGAVCRGLSPRAARERLEEIVAFAELASVIDRPFKTYSSGMQARLLFSTSIHVDADILIIDEALAAGDALFQEKCYRRLKQLATSGRTVLFVSHAVGIVQQLCNRALLLHEGRLAMDGEPGLVIDEYNRILAEARQRADGQDFAGTSIARGAVLGMQEGLKLSILDVAVRDEAGRRVEILEHGRTYETVLRIAAAADVPEMIAGFRLHLASGLVLYAIQNTPLGVSIGIRAGEVQEVRFRWPCRLQAGQYLLSCGVGEVLDTSQGLYPAPFKEIHLLNSAMVLNVVATRPFGGLFDLGAEVSHRTLAATTQDA